MKLKRIATFGVVGGALAAWLAAAATSGPSEGAAPPPIKPPAIDSRGAELTAEIQRLHERLRPSAAPRQPGRNLFEFSTPRVRERHTVEAPAAITEPAVPAPPPLKLAGLAEDAGPDGSTIRTAILSSGGQIVLAKEGDLVAARYRITKISAGAVDLVDVTDNATLRLLLK